jgi:outer membrane protein assembly factor BamB
MTRRLQFVVAIGLAALSTTLVRGAAEPRPGIDWPSFRGIQASGVSDGKPVPATWDVATRRNVIWQTAIEGLGHSSPIIWGNRLCVTTAISGKADAGLKMGLYGDIDSVPDDTSHTWKLLCYDKTTGSKTLEKTILTGVPKIKRHMKATHANSTLATDGTHLVAMLGSEGLYAFDMSGNVVWKKDLGVLDSGFYMVPDAQWEFGSSPVLHDNVVVIQADVQKNSFLAAFDASSGKELWRTARNDVPTWSTPTVYRLGDRTLIVVNGMREVGAYDFKTGASVWTMTGGGDIPVPTPVVSGGLIYITNAHGQKSPVIAIKETASGNVSLVAGATSNAGVAWSIDREGGYMITPVVYQGLLYVVRHNGVINVYDARTGEKAYQDRLGGGTSAFTSSLIAADGKVFSASEDGDVYVIKAGKTFEVIGKNSLGDVSMATPAISEGVLYFRTGKGLMAIGSR